MTKYYQVEMTPVEMASLEHLLMVRGENFIIFQTTQRQLMAGRQAPYLQYHEKDAVPLGIGYHRSHAPTECSMYVDQGQLEMVLMHSDDYVVTTIHAWVIEAMAGLGISLVSENNFLMNNGKVATEVTPVVRVGGFSISGIIIRLTFDQELASKAGTLYCPVEMTGTINDGLETPVKYAQVVLALTDVFDSYFDSLELGTYTNEELNQYNGIYSNDEWVHFGGVG